MFLRNLWLGLLCTVCCVPTAWAEGYHIDLLILHETEKHDYYLGGYYGDKPQFMDTATLVSPGHYRFSKPNQTLPPGVYFITQNKGSVDFIIEESLHFSVDVADSDLSRIIAFKNSNENTLYKNVLDTLSPMLNELKRADSLLRATPPSSPEYAVLYQQLIQLSENINQIKSDFIQKNPKHLMSLIFESQKEVSVPDAPENLDTEETRMWKYQYYKSHFFDHIRLADPRLIRTPILYSKTEQFLDQVVISQPDSIIAALTQLFEKASINKEIYQFLVDYTTLKYDRAHFIGQDAVWVFLVENYYLKGLADWATPATLENFSTRLKRVKPWLIGERPPEMWYPDTSNNREFPAMTSLFSPQTPYTVILFWEADCPHCKRELGKLSNLHKRKNELGIEIITVARDPDIKKMKKVIKDMDLPFVSLYGGGGPGVRTRDDVWPIDAVPTLYLLDQNKRIIIKKISADHIEDVIKNYQK